MKKIPLLLVLCLLVLSACGQGETIPTTTADTQPAPTQTVPACVHEYLPADCDSPKTCALCGAQRGSALGHDYLEGICTRCGQADATYLPLVGGSWSAVSISETGGHLEELLLIFEGESCTLSGLRYARLSDVPAEERTDAMLNDETWFDYSGEIYYRSEVIPAQRLHCTVEGNLITCTLVEDDVAVGTLILERTAGNMLSVTYFGGDFAARFVAVGDVFSGAADAH